MTILYIEPKPGNGKGYLKNTYKALREHSTEHEYRVCVVGHGYPPIFVEVDDETLVPEIEDKVYVACEKEVHIFKVGPSFEGHSNKTSFPEVESEEDKKKPKAVTNPQPHVDASYEKLFSPENIELTEEEQEKAKEMSVPDQPAKADDYEFDVFLAYNSDNKSDIKTIAQKLKQNGLIPWFDEEQVLAGELFQDKIQAAIPKSRTVVQFVGLDGFGDWQRMELRAFLSQCVKKGIPVIPVLLPGVDQLPDNLLFLKEFNWVQFKNIQDKMPLNKLVRGIKGAKLRDSVSSPEIIDNTNKNDTPPQPLPDISDHEGNSNQVDEDKLLYALERFTTKNLRTLCDKLAIKYNDFKGDTKEDTTYSIFAHYRDNDKLSELDAKAREVNSAYFNV